MDRLQMRATTRSAARTARSASACNDLASPRARSARDPQSPPQGVIDDERARRACAPMGVLESIVVSKGPRNRTRTWYVIVPDPATEREYNRRGLRLAPGCRVLVDAAALRPLAVLSVRAARERVESDHDDPSPIGFNPYFDVPGA